MTVEIFLALLTLCSIVTSVITEAVKKLLDSLQKTYCTNVVVLIIAICIGCVSAFIFYLANSIPITLLNVIYMVVLGIANWIGAMVGYDKLKQTIEQIKK